MWGTRRTCDLSLEGTGSYEMLGRYQKQRVRRALNKAFLAGKLRNICLLTAYIVKTVNDLQFCVV